MLPKNTHVYIQGVGREYLRTPREHKFMAVGHNTLRIEKINCRLKIDI